MPHLPREFDGMWMRHPPAGRLVPNPALFASRAQDPRDLWPGAETQLFTSGTAALAIAIRHAICSLTACGEPKVALPAYGCPNLVAAALWAGGSPIYYDISSATLVSEPESIWKLLDTDDTVVVHVDPFGVRTFDDLRLGPQYLTRVVHDFAQSYRVYEPMWRPIAQYNVISMGRAKPLSLTLGGALICPTPLSKTRDDLPASESGISRLHLWPRSAAYAASLLPIVFGPLSRIPGLRIGRTEYAPLTRVQKLPDAWSAPFVSAVTYVRSCYRDYIVDTERMLALAQEAGARVPLSAAEAFGQFPLWRIPVLAANSEIANELFSRGAHLGISRLYGRSLPEIMGMSREAAAERWPTAASIGETLVTLPAHGRLSVNARKSLMSLLRQFSR